MGDAGVPVGAELGVAEAGEDLLDHRPGNDTTVGFDVDAFADDADVRVAMGVSTLVSGMGAVGIANACQRWMTTSNSLNHKLAACPTSSSAESGNWSAQRGLANTRASSRSWADADRAGMRRSSGFANGVHQSCALNDRLGLATRSSCTSP